MFSRSKAVLTEGKDDSDAAMLRKTQALLNKLTPENFEKLYGDLEGIGIHKKNIFVEKLIALLFEKFTRQHNYIAMYGDLCKRFDHYLESIPPRARECNVSVRSLLVNHCQNAFEQFVQDTRETPKEFEGLEGEELFEAQVKHKKLCMGNVKLVGHLIARKMVSSKVLFFATEQLFTAGTDDAIEALTNLLMEVCGTLDTPRWKSHYQLNALFFCLKKMAGILSAGAPTPKNAKPPAGTKTKKTESASDTDGCVTAASAITATGGSSVEEKIDEQIFLNFCVIN